MVTSQNEAAAGAEPGARPGGGRALNRVALASFVGTAIEFYDFYIYGTAAALVINSAFFPNLSPVIGTLAAFSTFAVAFIARPLGSLLFGHFGDRVGRKSMLVASLLTMGLSTVAIGLLPSHATIGVLAPVLLVVLRFLQGLGLGGEWGGAALLAAEYAPRGKRGWYSTFPQIGPSIGFFAASGAFLVLSSLQSDEAFRAWGWRVPFLASALLVVVGLVVRLRIAETPVFAEVIRRQERSSLPLVDMLRTAPVRLLLGGGTIIVSYVLFYIATTFGLSYATSTLHIPKNTVLLLQVVAIWAMAVATVLACRASDRFGRRAVLLSGCGYAVVAGLLFFPLLDTRSLPLVCLAFALALAGMGWVYGPLGAFLPELFPARFRYSASSFAYNLGGVLGGALAPTIATWLVAGFGSASVGYYMAGAAVISLLCVLALPETRQTQL
ncbi:MFS transporter [Goodfellowiella coeruleoviolacea]|uniref:Putative proline/betaine transporter n=1 Tax=Goodfellowiella coeruleoviolacea TaxID=334858 RepID=A0AAE3KF96_9PSEU|nr:MFS transporter [Goodfellowiella coeruleoviolacea]MCP2164720.1 metabolite-proton symporter [Goodfellowiella coeruleoviolacea]